MIINKVIIVVAVIAEVAFLTIWQRPVDQGGSRWNPLWLFLISLFIGVYPMISTFFERNELIRRFEVKLRTYFDLANSIFKNIYGKRNFNYFQIGKYQPLFLMGLVSLSFILFMPKLILISEKIPIAPSESDIIPQIQIFVARFLSGEFPYQPITEFGYHLFSPYMPLHWGPYVIPHVFHFDERWFSLIVFALSVAYFCWKISQDSIHIVLKLILTLLPVWILMVYIGHDVSIFAKTVELLIAGYYLFFACTLLGKSPYLQAIGLSLCLLSRYFLIFWVPLYLYVLLKGHSRKTLWITISITFISILFLYLIPYFFKDTTIISQGLAHHYGVMLGNWTHDLDTGYGALYMGVGFAGYFAPILSGEVAFRLSLMSQIHILGSIAIIVVLGLFYWKMRGKIDSSLFLIASFKVYLTFFYTFLPLPILYYFFVPLCVSVVVIFLSMRAGPPGRS